MDSILSQFKQTLAPVISSAGISTEEFDQGFEALRYGASRLALEAGHAESQGIPFHEAISDPEQFPMLWQIHHSLSDILVLELPPELLPLAHAARDMVEHFPVEPLRYQLARAACTLPDNSPDRALARYVLFEAVRLNLLVATIDERPTLAYADIDDPELSQLASNEVARLIESQDDVFSKDAEPVRPLHLLVAAALSRLTGMVEQTNAVASVAEEVRDACRARARAEESLKGFDPVDALLLRNWISPLRGQQRLSFNRLSNAHPLLFDDATSRNTLEKRLSRNRQALENGNSPQRKVRQMPTFIEILRLAEEGNQ